MWPAGGQVRDGARQRFRRDQACRKRQVELFRTDLKNVAEKTKSLPDAFINAEGNGVTDAFVEYAMPLVGGLPKTEYLGGYPRV